MNTTSSYRFKTKAFKIAPQWLYAIGLMALCLYFFRGIVFQSHLLFGSDFVGFYQGMKQFLLDHVQHHGSVPFWNPYVFGGMPFWAHLESTIFYPLDFLFWFMAPEKAFGYTMFLHLVLAVFFMYGLLRSLYTTPAGSFLGAVVFISNGFIMATLYDGQMFRVQAYIWLPLVIYFVNRALKRKDQQFSAALAGLFWGFQILSGSPQDALYTLMAVILFTLFQAPYERPFRKTLFKQLIVLFLLMGFGLGIASIQVIPAMEFIRLSVRAVFDAYEQVTLGSYPLQGIITSLIPNFFGHYATGDFWVSNVPWSVPLYNLYVGILPLVLICFLTFHKPTDRKLILFGGILALTAFFLALGANTCLYQLFYLLPGFDRIRAPAKIIYLYVFALSLLTAKGMDGVLCLPKTSFLKRVKIVIPCVLLLIFLDIIFRWNHALVFSIFSPFVLDETIPAKITHGETLVTRDFHVIAILAFAILLVLLFHIKGILNKTTTKVLLCLILIFDLGFMSRGAVRYGDKGYGWAEKVRENLHMSLGRDDSIFRVGSHKNSMGPNFEMYLGYQTVAGYNPLYLHRYYEYIRKYNPALLAPGEVFFFYTPQGQRVLMDLLNVKYEISHDLGIYSLRKSAFPRVFFVPDCEVLPKDEILNRLVQPDFDPRQTVLFEAQNGNIKPAKPIPSIADRETKWSVDMVVYEPNRISVSAELSNSGWLFFSEIYYPGWKAFVDGHSAPLLRGNYIFRVVPVPRGSHRVTLVFDPFTVKLGTVVTLLTLSTLLLLGFCLWVVKRRQRLLKKTKGSTHEDP